MKKQKFIFSTILVLLLTGMFVTLTTREVKAATETIFEQDFEACNLVSGSDSVYQASGGFAGASNGLSIVENGINGKSLKVAHEFWPKADGGWQREAFYKDNLTMASADAYYGIYFEVEVFGNIDYIYFKGAKGIDGAQVEYNVSAGTITPQGDDGLSADFVKEGNVYKIQMSWQGNGGNSKVFFFTNVHSTDPEGDAGYYLIDNFKFLSSDSQIDELDNHVERTIYEQDFTDIATSVVGSDAMYGATGFAGALNGLSIAEDGIDGKSLKVVHTFWPLADGGWQKETMYQTVRLAGTVSTKLYELSTDIKLFGSVGQADFKLLFNDAPKGSVTLRKDGSHQVNTAESDKSIVKDILVSYDSVKQVFHLDYVFNGADGNLMFINYMNTTSDEGETGFYLDNFKLVKILPKTAREKVQGTYEDIFTQNFDSLTAGTKYATGGDMYQAIGFAGPNDTEKTTREIIADGIHNNSLKIIYDFFDNNCPMGSVYLDWNKAIGTPSEVYTIYKFEVNIKTVGNVATEIYKNMGNWIGINLASGATWGPAGVDNFIYSESTLENGVYHYVAYLYGNGAALTDTFEVHIVPDTTDPTGLIIDDYKVSKKVSNEVNTEPVVVDYTPTIGSAKYELGANTNIEFDVNLKGLDITLFKIGERTLTDTEYTVNDNKLAVNYQVLEELDPGEYTVSLSTTESTTSTLIITNIQAQISGHYVSRYSANFDDIEAGNYTGDQMYHINGFAGVNTQIVEDGINNKSLKATYNFYSVAEGGWQNGNLYIDSSKTQAKDINTVYKISYKIKPFGAYGMVAFGIQFADNSAINPVSVIYLKSDGTYLSDPNDLLIKYDVTYADGVFTVDAYYKSAGYYLFNYWHMQRTDNSVDTGFMLDDYSFSVVENPSVVVAEDIYDIVVQDLPAIVLNLAGFDVQHVKVAGTMLVKDTDYKLTALDNGNTKLELTKEYLSGKSVGDVINLDIRTTKSTNLTAKVTVVNAKPIITEKESVFQLDSNKDVELTIDLKGADITSVTLGETALTSQDYALAGNKLTIKSAFLQTMAVGSYTLTVTTGDSATTVIKVSDADRIIAGTYSPVYSQDFEGINAGRYTEEQFYPLSDGFAGLGNDTPGRHEVTEEKYLKAYYNFFPVAEGGWQNGMIYLNSGRTPSKDTNLIYKISFQVSGFGAWAQVCHGIQVAESGYPIDWLHLYSDGTYQFETNTNLLVKCEVQYANGAFNVTLYYKSAGFFLFNMWNCQRTDDNVETGIILDNFVFAKMDMPEYVSGNTNYDKAVNNNPYYLLDLYGYDITSITVSDAPLVKDTDYTVEALFGSTRVRLELTPAFLSKYNVGDNATLVVLTSKGNTIELQLAIVDTTPTVPATTNVDIAENKNVELTVDLKNNDIEKITLNNTDLAGNEYTLNSDKTTLTFKKEYLAKFEDGTYTFTLTTTSGATKEFTFVVSNTTPTISNAEYKKGSNTAVEFTVDLKGKELAEVKVDDTTLESSAYTLTGNKLTINASAFEGLTVGAHTVVIKTLGEANATVTVTDANPVITGTYSVTMGEALAITVDLFGRDITEVKVNSFVLKSNEYTYNNGELVIVAAVLEELSVNTHTVTITTTGGSAQVEFELKASATPVDPGTKTTAPDTTPEPSNPTTPSKKKGCNGGLGLAMLPVIFVSLGAIVLVRKREEQ